ncbi:MAG: histidinol-phosphate aminotransferase family protein [Acidobacteriota bacterium]|nr:histidinol-phosphate aminotransferase family protein [Acidobacteriota bacterium]
MIRARKAVERVEEYKPQPEGRARLLRLDLNENTVGCPAGLLRALRRTLTPEWCAVYPEYEQSRRRLARHFGVSTNEMIVTNGVDDSIMLICDTFVDPGDVLAIPSPTFSIYQFFHEVSGGQTRRISYGNRAQLPMRELIAAGKNARWMALANPNNPTGTLFSPGDLETLLKALPGVVVLVDEAYFDYSGVTILPWIRRFPNLIVSRTFSKAFGLAALRIGFMFASARLAGLMSRIHAVYAVNGLAATAAAEAADYAPSVQKSAAAVCRSREAFCRELRQLAIPFIPSSANFVLVRVGRRANELVLRLRRQGILVRGWSAESELRNCVRITIGTSAQMRRTSRALSALRSLFDECPRTGGAGRAAPPDERWFS